MDNIILAIHGGSGRIDPRPIPSEKEKRYKDKLEESLLSGYAILKAGGSSLDAVEAAINILEDSGLFNAGKGAVYSFEDINELDASIMDGRTLKAGSIAGAKTIKNPISAARSVMEKSSYVMLTGNGADQFALDNNLTRVDPGYFKSSERWSQHLKSKKEQLEPGKFGTVGAVALDNTGNLAAGTSTGGMMHKKYGRVGDSPIIGAGTYANEHCAVSCTGHGEYFICSAAAHDICALTEYSGLTIQNAVEHVVHKKIASNGGKGGVIALDAKGNVGNTFSTDGMFSGWITSDRKLTINVCNMIVE
ncbi:MAG: isoaspartyl peptidase/L-asparaginase [Bacteroidota bacterium]|nr:isoaspartyl peptidase/L-asparaginase [Bacteroidota bacterium]